MRARTDGGAPPLHQRSKQFVVAFFFVRSDQLFVNKQEQMVVCTARAEKNDYYIGKQGLHYILAQRG